jgi:hypothetical protein
LLVVAFLVPAASSQEATTGDPELDAAAELLRNQDIEGLMALVAMTPLGCAATSEIGGPPTCVPGSSTGTEVGTFFVGQCESGYLTTEEAVRQTLVDALGGEESSIYAVVETQSSTPEDDGYWIVVTESEAPSASAHATVWHFDREVNLVGLLLGCTSTDAATRVAELFPSGEFLFGPADSGGSPQSTPPSNLTPSVQSSPTQGRADVTAPDTGTGGSSSSMDWTSWAVGLALIAVAGLTVVLGLTRSRR